MVEHSNQFIPLVIEELGPLTKKQQELVSILELIRIEDLSIQAAVFQGEITVKGRHFTALTEVK